jgi:hypothetical protein
MMITDLALPAGGSRPDVGDALPVRHAVIEDGIGALAQQHHHPGQRMPCGEVAKQGSGLTSDGDSLNGRAAGGAPPGSPLTSQPGSSLIGTSGFSLLAAPSSSTGTFSLSSFCCNRTSSLEELKLELALGQADILTSDSEGGALTRKMSTGPLWLTSWISNFRCPPGMPSSGSGTSRVVPEIKEQSEHHSPTPSFTEWNISPWGARMAMTVSPYPSSTQRPSEASPR